MISPIARRRYFRTGILSVGSGGLAVCLVGTREIVEDGAIGPVVAAAAMGEMGEGFHHALHFGDLLFEIGDVDKRDFLYRRTLTALVLPEFQQRLGFFQ